MAIKTETELIDYILNELSGGGVIEVEVGEDIIIQKIQDTIQEFSMTAYDGTHEEVIIIDTVRGNFKYKLPDKVQEILELRTSTRGQLGITIPDGYVLTTNAFYIDAIDTGVDVQGYVSNMANNTTIQKYFDFEVDFDWNYNSKTLRFFEEPRGNKFMILASTEYEPDPTGDLIYNNVWIKEYATAKVKFAWGSNVGKFNGQLIDGAEINYADIKAEAREDLDRLREELKERYSEPLGIFLA